ncbi:oxysterol-binding protein-related protein 9 [Lepeophtheirus salmonis]|uniref:Oxysterol-binding protein n=1 Tax=Lepeophtheirus salmonis TaxID=72036 RepID=A0A0K2TBX7_LEPSM|nr:oxysterol-binding protein-related protein 9-like [Lepeophtheirus salmonis]
MMEDPRMIEGALSKWTNVMKGWQYRWFVLDANAGLFSYYTSKEKMSKGVRRGCVRLRGAVLGIDHEDEATFTITALDGKTFHFQANDAEERERWIRALEEVVFRNHRIRHRQSSSGSFSIQDFDNKLAETDCYLQLMLDRMDKLKSLKGGEDEEVDNLLKKADNMTESIKHAIVLLQITKNAILPQSAGKECPKIIQKDSVVSDEVDNQGNQERAYRVGKEGLLIANSGTLNKAHTIPECSYSSSEDEDFYDAEDNHQVEEPKSQGVFKENPTLKVNEDNTENDLENDDYDYDSLYSIVDESDSGEMDMKSHGSVISHLLSQVRIGMDLTKIVLPTFILERRSLLEMYSDFFAHPDLFIDIAEKSTPEDRMVAVLKWYLSSFHAGRRSSIAKKPYNPIIGETFYCHWDLPHSGTGNKLSENDPLPWCKDNNLVFVAEQVSHHPPISAFYAEHIKKRISVNAHIYTKSSFLGMSIAVHNVGQGSVKLLDYGEEYVATFPTGYGRSILTVPWIELGGKVSITCVQTNYTANIDFKCKPFFSSDVNKVFAEVISPTAKKPILKVDGEWNGRMNCKWVSGKSEVFIDVNEMPIVPKVCKSIFQQKRNESRRMWKDVTRHLKEGDIDKATAAKFSLEQKQRENAAARKANSVEWETKLFKKVGENWQFNNSLSKRV